MLNHISVDGFKSLTNFHLDLSPGLNVLVGPNGSGKTNVISFFEFLGNLQEMPVSEAICKSGGAGSVFTKAGEHSYRADMRCKVKGNIRINKQRVLFYQYSFTIGIHETFDSIGYHAQRLEVKYRTVITRPDKVPKKMDLDVEVMHEVGEKEPKAIIHSIDRRKIRSRYSYITHHGFDPSKEFIKSQIETMLAETVGFDYSLVEGLRYVFDEWKDVASDLRGGKTFNIVPSSVRTAEDSAKAPGMGSDGSGLYATLFAIKKGEDSRSRGHLLRRRERVNFVSRTTLPAVLKYMQLANDSIKKIDVINNPFDNQLQVRVWIGGVTESTVLPLSAMSDGTIKWLSLVTIILTTQSIFSIEEPENYLHPLMQAEILKIMRSSLRDDRFILMSTHSETLLNNATPDEVVVVEFKNGKTSARRPGNADDITREIQATGFGLGYYYIAGSFDE
jgi:predicted ATPase